MATSFLTIAFVSYWTRIEISPGKEIVIGFGLRLKSEDDSNIITLFRLFHFIVFASIIIQIPLRHLNC